MIIWSWQEIQPKSYVVLPDDAVYDDGEFKGRIEAFGSSDANRCQPFLVSTVFGSKRR